MGGGILGWKLNGGVGGFGMEAEGWGGGGFGMEPVGCWGVFWDRS